MDDLLDQKSIFRPDRKKYYNSDISFFHVQVDITFLFRLLRKCSHALAQEIVS